MKTLLLTFALIGSLSLAFGQTIDDNRNQFNYIQLPYLKVDKLFTKYDVKVIHGYLQGNEDALAAHELNKQIAMQVYEQAMTQYNVQVDSLDANYFRLMSKWEKDVNAGKMQADGLPLPQPTKPIYPTTPIFPALQAPTLNSPLEDNTVLNSINIAGFEKGLGGFVVTVNVLSLSDVQISESKSGTGTSTKYKYTATYTLPIEVTVETPTQGKLIFLRVSEGRHSYTIGEYASSYDYKLYMMKNKAQFHANLEASARAKAITETNNYLNDQIGFVPSVRSVELYSVKRFKDYDYSDVTIAYTKTVQALQLVSKDRNRASAIASIDQALADWTMIMQESNTYDNKARINDKISAMIQCNMAELLAWKGAYDQSEIQVNLAISEGGKFKRHASGHQGFYADQKKRWSVHY